MSADPMERPLRIAHVNSMYRLGGVETVVRQLHRGMTERGHRSRLFIGLGKDYPWGGGVRPLYPRLLSRMQHTRLGPRVERLFPRLPWSDRNFRRLADSDFDVVHLQSFHANYATLESLAWLAARKPVVWTLHSHWAITGGCGHPLECRRYLDACGECPHLDQWPMNGVDNTAGMLALKKRWLADLPLTVVTTSEHSERLIRTSPIARRWKLRRIYNGIGTEWAPADPAAKRDAAFRASLGLRPEARVIFMANRDYRNPAKGFPMALEALRTIDPKGVQLVLAGGESGWAKAQLPPGIDCLDAGYTTEERLRGFYRAADFFLFASEAENFPCVILEAMAARCCVVATPTQGVTEQIESGRDGWLGDSLSGAALGAALRRALGPEGRAAELAEAGRRRVLAEFSEKAMFDRHEQLYCELAGLRPASPE